MWSTDSGGRCRPDILTCASTALLIPAITPPPLHQQRTRCNFLLREPGAQRDNSVAMETSELLLLLALLSAWSGADSLKLRK